MGLAKLLNYKPVVVVGLIVALHTIMYGVGYVIPTIGFSQTVLYSQVGDLLAQAYFGIALLAVGFTSIYAWLSGKERLIALTSTAQAVIWLFVTFVYFLSGFFALGVAIGLVWTFLAGYMGYIYRNRIHSHYKE